MPHGQDNVLLDPLDPRWFNFVGSNPYANIFHHPAWMNLLAKCYGHRPFVIATLDDQDNICAGVPVMEINNAIMGRRWVSLPYTDHCSPLSNGPESVNRLVNHALRRSRTRGVRSIELRSEYPPHPVLQAQPAYVLHTVKLESDFDSVVARFRRDHRHNIQAARKMGVRIERGSKPEHLEEFYQLHLETRRRKGVPVQPKRFFELINSELLEQGLGFSVLAYKDTTCLAGAIFLHWQHTLTYKYAASRDEGRVRGTNHLVLWSAIRWACENAYATLDLGRTDLPHDGLRDFKRGWGADETPLIYNRMPAERSSHSGGRLMGMMNRVIRNSPPWVCQAAGEALYRYFG